MDKRKGRKSMKYISTIKAAKLLKKDRTSLARWANEGLLNGAIKNEKDEWQIPIETFEEISRMNDIDSNTIKIQNSEIGKKYGSMTILDVVGYKKEGSNNRIFVLVGCDCGTKKEMPLYWLTGARVKTCSKTCVVKSGFELGDQYGLLTIIGDEGLLEMGFRANGNIKRLRHVKTICICGIERVVPLSKLKCGHYNACSKTCPTYLKDIIGNQYGKLIVIQEIERKDKERRFICKCECGKVVEKNYNKLISRGDRYCEKGCLLRRGEGSPSWKAEKTMEERIKGRDYWEYEQWRKKVFVRDKYCCKKCGKVGGDMIAHHVDGYNWCKEKRTDVNNGCLLCENCHTDYHLKYGYGDNTKQQFEEWLGKKVEEVILIEV